VVCTKGNQIRSETLLEKFNLNPNIPPKCVGIIDPEINQATKDTHGYVDSKKIL